MIVIYEIARGGDGGSPEKLGWSRSGFQRIEKWHGLLVSFPNVC